MYMIPRILITLLLIYGVYIESGPLTALAFLIIALFVEFKDWSK